MWQRRIYVLAILGAWIKNHSPHMSSLDSVQGWFCEALCMVMAAWDGEMLPLAARGLVGKASVVVSQSQKRQLPSE